MTHPDNIIDMGPIKLQRDGDNIVVIDRYGEEAIVYLDNVLGGTDWVPDESDPSGEREVERDSDAEWDEMHARFVTHPHALVHMVDFDEDGYGVQHPVTERKDDSLLTCPLHTWLATLGRWPASIEHAGRYIATPVVHDPTSSSFRSDAEPWTFEEIGYPCRVCGYANTCGEPPGEDCHS